MPSLKKLTRDQLNDKALRLGIAGAVEMKNRAAVIEAIEEAKEDDRPQARVVSVFGNGLRVLVETHVDWAREIFGDLPLAQAGRSDVVDATTRELAAIRTVSPEVADSALAAAALQMAFEVDHPYNSATSKANCANELHKLVDKLRELCPAGEGDGEGALDELKARRAKRRAKA